MTFKDYNNPVNLVLAWLGFSILMHAFPSTHAPFILLVYVFAIGSVLWLDVIYAAAVGLLVPNLLVNLI